MRLPVVADDAVVVVVVLEAEPTRDKERTVRKLFTLIIILALSGMILGCGPGGDGSYGDKNTEVAKGEPDFPPLGMYWVIDRAKVLSDDTIINADDILLRLQQDGIAEVVIVVIPGVKQPETWATHYGRWLKLGKKGSTAEGGANGLVWLIRPDADLKMTISVGRGLPRFTSVDYGQIMDDCADYFNFGNYDAGVSMLAQETSRVLREIYSN